MTWYHVTFQDRKARELADRHYPRQRRGARQFMPPGQRMVLLTGDARAVWGVVHNVFRGVWRWRCTLFRNEGAGLSSELIVAATAETYRWWETKYGGRPAAPLRTEVDPKAVRRKRDPGRCFLRAGWRLIGPSPSHRRRGMLVFEAPP